jgi:hypothetical protein
MVVIVKYHSTGNVLEQLNLNDWTIRELVNA